MPSVKKFTLVIEFAKKAKEEKLFDEGAIANVTQSPNLRRIQGEMVGMLDLKLHKETVPGKASCLRERTS
jgi:hypothetical protein